MSVDRVELDTIVCPNRRRRRAALVLCLAVCLLTVSGGDATAAMVFESFDDDPAARGWTGLQNTTSGNSYGYSPSSQHAGGQDPGEAGGTMARLTSLHYYADTELGGVLSLDDPISSTGSFSVGNRQDSSIGQRIGFLDPAAPLASNNLMISLGEPATGTSTYRARLQFRFSDGSQIRTNAQSNFGDGSYSYALNYDPAAGVAGSASLDIFNSAGGLLQHHTLDLTAAHRSIGASFSAFGLFGFTDQLPNSNETYDLFLDDVSYTVAVPEPSACVMAMFGLLGLGFYRWRRRNAA